MTDAISLGIIGGSGLYSMDGLIDVTERNLDTPFGKPSAPIVIGTLHGTRIAFLARHGIGHHISPTEINYRANIYALKMLGIRRVISISACGSLREDYAPGHIVIPDQIYDNTKNRQRTFFQDGLVAHINVADPFCPALSGDLAEAVSKAGGTVHKSGTYITVEGPRFSTKAESHIFRSWGMSIIGMTTSPEAFLAREAEMCYAVMAHVTDYDVWHVSESPVTVEMVVQALNTNTTTELIQASVRNLVYGPLVDISCDCESALATALITNPKIIPSEIHQKLKLLVGKYLS